MSLVVSYSDLLNLVGRHLGWGPTASSWNTDTTKVADAASILNSGLRMVYFPLPMIEGQPPHQFSFLTPVAEQVTEIGTNTYPLPVDFVTLKTPFTIGGEPEAVRLAQKNDSHLSELIRHADTSGKPEFYSVRPTRTEQGGVPGYEVRFWPRPDAVYTLSYQYVLSPPRLSDVNPYHLGGPQLSELVVEAVLACADKALNDTSDMHDAKFRELLAAAILADQRMALDEGDGEDIWESQDGHTLLSVTRAYLRRIIGRHLGYGPHPAIWNRQQVEEIRLAMETGLRKFYNPAPLPGERYGHEWSFLRPLGVITTVGAQHTYDLPDDFAMISGPLTHAPEATVLYPPVEVYGEEQIRLRRQSSTTSGRPLIAAVSPVTSPAGLTRYQLSFWPTPDSEYVLQYRYQISPDSLTDEQELPIGGPAHAQTVLEACLAAADEVSKSKDRSAANRFLERLVGSVGHDRKVHAPDTLGFNSDRSAATRPGWDHTWHDHDENIVTYGGNVY